VGVGIIPEFRDARVPFQDGLHDAALNAATAAVNQPHFGHAGFGRRGDVLVNHRGHIARRKGVEIDFALDRNPYRRLRIIHGGFGEMPLRQELCLAWVAVTTVLIPPRTEKSPTTVMLRGSRRATRSSRIWLVTLS